MILPHMTIHMDAMVYGQVSIVLPKIPDCYLVPYFVSLITMDKKTRHIVILKIHKVKQLIHLM